MPSLCNCKSLAARTSVFLPAAFILLSLGRNRLPIQFAKFTIAKKHWTTKGRYIFPRPGIWRWKDISCLEMYCAHKFEIRVSNRSVSRSESFRDMLKRVGHEWATCLSTIESWGQLLYTQNSAQLCSYLYTYRTLSWTQSDLDSWSPRRPPRTRSTWPADLFVANA